MKKMQAVLICTFVACFSTAVLAGSSVNVTQHHNNLSRDGLYIDPTITTAAAANVTRDTNFDGTIVGNVYAQPLYIEDGPGGVAMVIAVTQSNNVYALNAATGAIIWQRNVGTPSSGMGNISPLGITGTPVVDLATRSLFFDAVISGPNNMIYSLNVDTGAINPGWPVDVNATISGFSSSIQSQRAALTVIGSTVYVPYGGYFGDAGNYHGRVVGVQVNNPASVGSYATAANKAGIWGPGGIASDGTDIFVTTGNGSSGAPWSGSEAVIRLQPGPIFSGSTVDFWAPTNWQSLDSSDADLGGSGPIVVDVPGATPSALVVAIGKDRNAYILNRANLGGVSAPLSQGNVSTSTVINAATSYRTTQGTYVALRPTTGTLTSFRITATNPPTVATGWSVSSSGRTSPFITSSDGLNDMIVWAAGSDGRLRGYNGDTGVTVFSGGGASDVMSGIRSFNTGIAARGRIYYAGDNKVYAFNVPSGATPTPSPTPTPTPTPTCGPNTFSATLQGSQEVPPNGSTATGSGTATLDQTQTMITVNLNFSGLSANASASHIHAPAPPGSTAPVAINFTGFPNTTSGTYSNTFPITPTQVSQLMSGLGYFNIHNGNFPNGEIRGQLTLCGPTPTPTGTPSPTPTLPPTPTPTSSPSPTPQTPTPVPSCSPGAFTATLQGAQEVPPNGSTATGSGTVTLDQTQTMITVSVNFTGLSAAASAAHIHAPAAPGSTAPVAINFTGFPNATSGTYNNTFPITPTQLSQLFSGLGYINIHNANFPNGEIRGQLTFCGPTPSPTPGVTPTPTSSPGVTPTPTATPGGTETPTPTPGVTATPTATPGGSPARALNISTRLRVETGSNVLIGGFIISGTSSKNVVVRGIGPSLTGVGITDALADPTLELRGSDSSLIRANDNWQDDPAQAALLTGAGLGLQDPSESGIAETLQAGNSYTTIVAGKNNGTGVGLVEIYDISPAVDGQAGDAQLANISTRGFVQTGSNVMIGGFILGGTGGNTHVAIRGIGPSLAKVGLSPVLADPTLELHDANGTTLVSNNDWQDDPVSASQLTFHELGLSDSHESGIFTSLPPGLFTAILFGDSSGTGIGLIEIYNLH